LEDYVIIVDHDEGYNLQNQTIAVYNFVSYPQLLFTSYQHYIVLNIH